MHITVFGASGKVGRQVVTQILADGHEVTVFVHHKNPFEKMAAVTIVQGDIHDAIAVKRAVKGSEAVICTLGSWHTKTKDIVSSAIANLIPAMEEQGIRRIITVTGAGALWEQDKPTLFDQANHAFLKLVAPKILRDGEGQLEQLADCGLDWTCVRSPIMTRGRSRRYRLSSKLPLPWATIPRAAVVRCLIDQLMDRAHYRSAPIIGH